MEKPRCGACWAYEALGAPAEGHGVCHMGAPTVVPGKKEGDPYLSVWPPCDLDDWCGDYTPIGGG